MEAKISDVFWSLTSFEDLKKYLRQGNDFCKDVSSIINERVKVEMTYMEGLAKLSVRAKKATGDTLGTMKNAWEGFANQCEQEAEVRKSLAGDLLEQIVKPFKAFVDAQAKTKKQAELNVEKAGKSLADKRSDEMKSKKTSFSRSKDAESLTVQLEGIRGKTGNEKELSKIDTKCKKAEESVQKSDKEHIGKIIQAERARLSLESIMRSSCNELQSMEEERISYVKNMLRVYGETLKESVPKVSQCYDQFSDQVENINIGSDIEVLMNTKGSPKQPGEQILSTCYEADMSSVMDKQRRKLALEHKYEGLNKVLRAEKKARAGLAKLASVYQETPTFTDAGTVDDVSTQIEHANAVIDCLDASLYHINSSLASVNGFEPPQHRLADCIYKTKDKQNLPLLILKVPSDKVTIGIPEEDDYEDLGPQQYDHPAYDSDEFEDIEDAATSASQSAAYALAENSPLDYSASANGHTETWRAIYDYTAAQPDELTIATGDIIKLISKSEGGWWQGELNGVTGLFPANYVEQV